MLGIDRDRVWSALHDPAVLVRTIPGCERLEETGPDTYRMTVTAGVASIKGVYQGEVSLAEPEAPQRFVLRARGQGAPGTVDATVEVRLSEVEDGTRVDYDAEAVVGGMIGGVGQRMLTSVAKRTAGEFFTAVEKHLVSGDVSGGALPGETPVPAAPVPGTRTPAGAAPGEPVTTTGHAAPGGPEYATLGGPAATVPAAVTGPVATRPAGAAQVFERPAPPPKTGVPPWSLLAAFGMGAGIALGSAVIGWLLGRTRRR